MERIRQSLEVELIEWGGGGEGKKGVEDEVSFNLGDRGFRGVFFQSEEFRRKNLIVDGGEGDDELFWIY